MFVKHLTKGTKMKLNLIRAVLEKQDGSKLSQYLTALSGAIVIFTVGIHLGWPAPSLKKIMSEEYPFDISADEGSYIAIISCVGHVIGGFSASTLSDIIGRKWTLLLIAVPQVVSFLMVYFSYGGTYLLYCARVAGGIGEGGTLAILPMYIAEISEPAIRGTLGTFTLLICLSGCLFINLLGSYIDIHTTALICLSFPVINWLIFINFPDTPYYLVMKNKTQEATESLRVLRRRNSVDKEIMSITADVNRQMSESGTYKDLFTIPSNRRAFFLMSVGRFFQQFTGCTAFGMYYQILIEESTNLSPVMGSSLLLLTQVVMAVIASFTVDKFGRKPLFTVSSAMAFLVLLILGIFFILKDYTSVDVSAIDWFPLPMMILFIVAFFIGLGVGLNILSSEIYSTSIKAKALSLGSLVFAITMMSSTKFYQFTADNYGMAVPFLSFAACTFVGTLFFWFVVPETKGKTLEGIQQDLKDHSTKNASKKTIPLYSLQ